VHTQIPEEAAQDVTVKNYQCWCVIS